MGFERPDDGQIVVAYKVIDSSEARKHVNQRVVMISQSAMVVEALTVQQNVEYAFHLREDYDESNIQDVVAGMLQIGDLYELRTLKASDLPFAQRRMLAFLHALANQPECILFDEPTAELDPLLSRKLCEFMLRLKHELRLTMLLPTNDLDLTRQFADKVLFLDRGRVVFVGHPEEFFHMSRLPGGAVFAYGERLATL